MVDRARRLGSPAGSRRKLLRSDVSTGSATFEISGLSELKTKLDRLSTSVRRDAMRQAGLHALDLIADTARGLVPVGETGRLKASIRVPIGVTKSAASLADARSRYLLAGVSRVASESETHTRLYMGAGDGSRGPVFYAMYKEYGTIHLPAEAFMRPAVDSTGRRALDEIGLFLTWEIRKAMKGGPAGALVAAKAA